MQGGMWVGDSGYANWSKLAGDAAFLGTDGVWGKGVRTRRKRQGSRCRGPLRFRDNIEVPKYPSTCLEQPYRGKIDTEGGGEAGGLIHKGR